MFKRTHSSRCALVILLVFVVAPLLMAAVPAGIDWRVLVVDGTGAAMGTAGNPVVTTGSGSAGSVTQGTSPWVVAGGVAPNAAASQNPILMAGSFGGNVKVLGLDTNGQSTTNQGTQNAAGTASWNVQGAGATGAAVAGNPLYIGAIDTSGNLQPLKMSDATNNLLKVQVGGGGNVSSVSSTAADNFAAGQDLFVASFARNFNGTNWDRVRNNVDATLLASASRTTTQTSADIITYNAGAVIIVLDMTVVGTGSVTLSIDGKDVASGKYFNLLTGAAVVTNVTNVYTVDPAVNPPVANVSAQKRLPRTIRIVTTANNANPATYSVGYCLQPT